MRIRDIIDIAGQHLRLTYDPGFGGAGPTLRLVDLTFDGQAVLLDLYGGELLAGYLVSARLAGREKLASESACGQLPVTFAVGHDGKEGIITVRQGRALIELRRSLWDRLYSELLLFQAHGRHRAHPQIGSSKPPYLGSRLLH